MSQFLPLAIGAGINALALINPRRAAEIALDVFCTPRAGRHKDYHSEYLSQYHRTAIPTEHGDMACFVRPGSGPTVLLAHGWESNAFRWRKLLSYLAETDYKIVMMEAPGHGGSAGSRFTAIWYAEAMVSVVTAFEPTAIVGHSVGAYATSYFLAHNEHPTVRGVVLLASPDRLSLINDNYFSLLKLSNRVRRRYDALLQERFHKRPTYFNASDFMSRVDLPGIVIHDRDDVVNQYFEGQAIVDAWPLGKLYTTAGLGHSLQSAEVFEQVASFLSSIR